MSLSKANFAINKFIVFLTNGARKTDLVSSGYLACYQREKVSRRMLGTFCGTGDVTTCSTKSFSRDYSGLEDSETQTI